MWAFIDVVHLHAVYLNEMGRIGEILQVCEVACWCVKKWN
jgi:hypothetical protein